MAPKLFLFDLDWTLVYTGGAGLRALDYAFEKRYKIANAMKTISPDGKTDPAIIREMIHAHLKRAPQEGEIEALCKAYVERLAVEVPIATGYRVLPGIPELLESLSQRPDILLGLGTGNLEEGARVKLARSGLMRYFKFGGYASDAEGRAEVLRTAVKRGEALAGTRVSNQQVFVIGDNFRDVEAGKAIGAKTVAVATGHMTVLELGETHPDFLFHNFAQHKDVLEKLLP